MPVTESILAALADLAQQQPDDVAFTFVDYDVDPEGFAESLTWSQLKHRTHVVAEALARRASVGDRAAILAPQGLDYIVGFLGALQAGLIAVPLSAPQFGIRDERVTGALADSTPSAILTTSAVVDDVMPYAAAQPGGSIPAVVEIDALDFDSPRMLDKTVAPARKVAYLQYTSGSTRRPAGVVVSDRNVVANVEQMASDYFEFSGGVTPQAMVFVSWLPLYHDMGLFMGILAPILTQKRAVLISPMAFLQRPARWMQLLADNHGAFSAAPNFGFELAMRRTTDEDLAGRDLSGILGILSGAERVNPGTIRRFHERFARFNISDTVVWPSYGLAEATVYVTAPPSGRSPVMVRFDYEKLSAGHAQRCEAAGGSELVSCGAPRACTVRIVDPETRIENPAAKIGEIWVHGDNVASSYWRNPQASKKTFGGKLVNPSPGTPQGPWLRTGDLGVMSEGELFIIGRIKDMLIVDGRNHYPEDIEATIQTITAGRVAAISIQDDESEQLVAIVEFKNKNGSDEPHRLRSVKREVTSAISRAHNLRVSDLVLVAPGSIPTTTSGKVRRSACVEGYQRGDFSRLDGTT